jgi:hypothetical protein
MTRDIITEREKRVVSSVGVCEPRQGPGDSVGAKRESRMLWCLYGVRLCGCAHLNAPLEVVCLLQLWGWQR